MKKVLTSQNPEKQECIGEYTDEFVNYWVPVIRKFRETSQFLCFEVSTSMNECLEIMAEAIKSAPENVLKDIKLKT